MRKVAFDNTRFCINKCKIFENLDSQQSNIEADRKTKQELSCFEKCLGKLLDSFEVSLGMFANLINKARLS